MTTNIITNKITSESTLDSFNELAKSANKIIIAVAFFSGSTIIESLLQLGKEISLIVSLRPPTNYYSLKQLLHQDNIEISFLGDEFHSKIFAFFDDEWQILSAIVGSSNFTNGGFSNNIETNVIIREQDTLNQIDVTLDEIIELSTPLQPDELNNYKKRYDDFAKFNERNKTTVKLRKPPKSAKITKKASEYSEFWNIADKVKDLVGEISRKEYPSVPEYLVIDHFWHWVVKICDPKKLKPLLSSHSVRDKTIPVLFKEYCDWDKSAEESYTQKMGKNSKLIQKLLSKNNISNLTSKNALTIYRSFHAAQSLIQRFGADKIFIKENSIKSIRQAFAFLLHESLPINYRIYELISANGTHKLNQFGPSCVQELIGWAKPKEMPLRNNKADKAVRLLGFRN